MAIPTVVYESKFPSTLSINLIYCVGHISLAIINLTIQYITVTDSIIPVIQDTKILDELSSQ